MGCLWNYWLPSAVTEKRLQSLWNRTVNWERIKPGFSVTGRVSPYVSPSLWQSAGLTSSSQCRNGRMYIFVTALWRLLLQRIFLPLTTQILSTAGGTSTSLLTSGSKFNFSKSCRIGSWSWPLVFLICHATTLCLLHCLPAAPLLLIALSSPVILSQILLEATVMQLMGKWKQLDWRKAGFGWLFV